MRSINRTVTYSPNRGMRGAALFLLRAVIGVLIALSGAFLFLLIENAPSLSNTPLARIEIVAGKQTVQLPNRIFNCTESNQQTQCNTTIEDQLLILNLQKSGTANNALSNCQAALGSKSIQCTATGLDYIGRKGLLSSYKLTETGLSYSQLRGLQQDYFWINALRKLNETHLMQILTGAASLIGFATAAMVWLYPGRLAELFVSFASGAGTYQLVGQWLGSVPYNRMATYGINSDVWNLLVTSFAFIAALFTGIATAAAIGMYIKRPMRIAACLFGSLGIAGLVWFSLVWLSNIQNVGLVPATVIAIAIGTLSAVLLWLRTNRSIRTFLCISSGFGSFGLLWMLFLFSLLELGYVD